MITHIEMSFQMGFIMRLIEMNLKSYGHMNPLIVSVSKDKNLEIDLNYDTVIDQKLCRVRDGMLLNEDEPEPGDVYVHVTMLRLKSDSDEEQIPVILKHIVKAYNPDAIGYVQGCLYNEYSNPDLVSRNEMLVDPDNIHVIHMCYFIRGDRKARLSIMPYLNKGLKKTDTDVFDPDKREDDQEHVVLINDCGWFRENNKVDPIIKYPYS